MTKVSTVRVVDEIPAQVFRCLYLRERGMRFKPAPAREGAAARGGLTDAAVEPDDELLLGDAPAQASVEGLLPAGGDDPDRHTDEWLQTSLDAESLDRSLRRIEEQARLTIEEQGVNTLFLTLGTLEYVESADSQERFRAPLVMLPVTLKRKSARSGFELAVGDDEPLTNPAIVEHLRQLGATLPGLPDSESIGDEYDLEAYFAQVQSGIADRKDWSVQQEIYLGLFSFQKFVMFKDLETHAAAIARHRLPRQLVDKAGGGHVGLPEEIRRMPLDQEFPPESTFQVVDADSSQLRAIAACAREYDLVVEGPPGTGKSQTITNLIAQALADGKSVLFVAEKMAALEVVRSRLNQADLGEFCLELHSSRANKRQVMQDLARTLDASLEEVAASFAAGTTLPTVRSTLSDYVRALHEPMEDLGISPFDGYGRLGAVRLAPAFSLALDVTAVSPDEMATVLRGLDDLTSAAGPIGIPEQHPWHGCSRTLLTETDLEAIRTAAEGVLDATSELGSLKVIVEKEYGVPSIETVADVDRAMSVGSVLAASPGAPISVLQSDAWNSPPPSALRVIDLGREVSRLRAKTKASFGPAVLDHPHRDDIAYVQRKREGAFGFLAVLDGRYRAISRRWKSYRLSGYTKSILEQAEDLRLVDTLAVRRSNLQESEGEARELFGQLWRGEHSDWQALSAYVDWVSDFRRTCVTAGVQSRAYQLASQGALDTTQFPKLRQAADAWVERFGTLATALGWAPASPDSSLAVLAARVQALRDNVDLGPRWAAFEATRREVEEGKAAELIPRFMSGALPAKDLRAAFCRAFYTKWLATAVAGRPALARFSSLTHEMRVAEFQDLDRRVLVENRGRLVGRLREAAHQRLQGEAARRALPLLQGQLARQRNIRPLRRILREAGAAIRAIKPCFMMSPMTVAQLLDGSEPLFDLIIFDEASQLPTEDAIGAVIRGKQLVVVGDPKQLPPTNFFSVMSGQIAPVVDEEGNPIFEDSESILEEFMGAGVPMSRLKWHYRSAHESLIRYSNVSFYQSELYTFPSIEADTAHAGLQFEYIPNGLYEGKGLNAVEARRVADEVVRFAREQLAKAEKDRLSLGVGTFNMRQQLGIQDELERRRRAEPDIEPFFGRALREPFFVKNLENIQGDERDVIFISVTYGPGTDGRIRYSFGPLTHENGWRRLNVLVTRARHRMRVFSSMRGDQINPAASGSAGPRLLREFLTFAEHGRLDGPSVTGPAAAESPFEQEVLTELLSRGVHAIPQVGVSHYRIDIGVLDDEMAGRFICGIECDGVAYHASETARDRDRLRQQVLEDRGWVIHRVWSTDWFKDRKGQIERLVDLIGRDRERARRRDEVERQRTSVRALEAGKAATELDAVRAKEGAELRRAVELLEPYRRPTAHPYVAAESDGQFAGQDILSVSETQLLQAVQQVVEVESPVHLEDVLSRVAARWDTKVGRRVRARIMAAIDAAVRSGLIRKRGDFVWSASDRCEPRSRLDMGTPANRIAPEEYRAAVGAVLAKGHSFARPQLAVEVRAVLGFSRTGALLEDAIRVVVDSMVGDGSLGEGSAGLRLRRPG